MKFILTEEEKARIKAKEDTKGKEKEHLKDRLKGKQV